MKPIILLHAITDMGVGGAERVVLDLIREMDRGLVDSRVVAFTDDRSGLDLYGAPDVPFDQIAVRSRQGLKPLRICDYVALLRDLRPDIVHAHMFHALLLTQLAVRFVEPAPKIVFTSHIAQIPALRRAWIKATRGRRAADIIFSEGQHSQLNAAATLVIPNGVPVAPSRGRPVRRSGSPTRFIFVGRLAEQKDPVGLVTAFAQAGLEGATLDMIGEGPLRAEVERKIRVLGLQAQVRLAGLQGDIRQWLRRTDALVLHSHYEGLPIALLEAGAEGLPVLSTPVGAIPTVLADDCGYLAQPSEYPAALRHIADHPDEAHGRGERLYAAVTARYSIAAMAKAHLHLYHSVLERSTVELNRL